MSQNLKSTFDDMRDGEELMQYADRVRRERNRLQHNYETAMHKLSRLEDDNEGLHSEVERLRDLMELKDWQPIEQAPKDGTDIVAIEATPVSTFIAHCVSDLRMVRWDDGDEDEDLESGWFDDSECEMAPTHFMLPPSLNAALDPPKSAARDTLADMQPEETLGHYASRVRQERDDFRAEVERLRGGLRFYADKQHMLGDWDDWESCSGEPEQILFPPTNDSMGIENGGCARAALYDGTHPPAPAVPDGYSLVPSRMQLDLGAMQNLLVMTGEDFTEDDFSECALWVGETKDPDTGETSYGLNATLTEYPEEGSTPVIEFKRPPAAAGSATGRCKS